jgi:hypothetical protein
MNKGVVGCIIEEKRSYSLDSTVELNFGDGLIDNNILIGSD